MNVDKYMQQNHFRMLLLFSSMQLIKPNAFNCKTHFYSQIHITLAFL